MEYDASDYMVDRDGDSNIIYLIAVEKGFSKQVGFDMVSKMKARFLAMTNPAVVQSAKAFALNPDFQSELKVLHVNRRCLPKGLALCQQRGQG